MLRPADARASMASTQRAPEFAVDFALLQSVEQNGEQVPVPMKDGQVLRRADGDRFQIYLSPSSDVHVYIYLIDGTGWIQRLYPDDGSSHVNPVRSGSELILPRSDLYFGLDEYPGVHEIFVLISPNPRNDVETALAAYPLSRSRPASAIRSRGRSVYEPVTIATALSRGVTVVEAGKPAVVASAVGQQTEITPTRVEFGTRDDERAFSVWFTSE
jgi:hypothetical protein